jgi:hypothetical protein
VHGSIKLLRTKHEPNNDVSTPVDPSTNQPLPVLYPETVPLVTRQGEVHDLPEDD